MGTSKKTFGARTNIIAFTASFGSEVRINLNHLDAFSYSLISNEGLQLEEIPAIKPKVKPFAFPVLAYSFKVLHNNSSSSTIINNLLADIVVNPSLETSLSSRDFLEQSLGASSAFGLKFSPQMLESEHVLFNLITTKKLPIAGYSDMVNPNINSNNSIRISWCFKVSGKCNMQKHPIFSVKNKQSSLRRPVKIFPVVIRDIYRYIYSSFYGCKPYFIKAESESSLVKSKGNMFLKTRLRAFIGLDRLKSLGSYPVGIYDELGGKIEKFPSFVIAKMMKLISPVYIGSVSFISYVGNSFGVLFHSIKKNLVFRDFDFDSSDRFHDFTNDALVYIAYAQMSSGKSNGGE